MPLKITLDDLAGMIKKEFDIIHREFEMVHKEFEMVHKEFELVHNKFEIVHKDINILKTDMKIVKEQVTNLEIGQEDIKARMTVVAYRVELKNLDKRVLVLEASQMSS